MFDQDRYFDVFVEYARGGTQQVLCDCELAGHAVRRQVQRAASPGGGESAATDGIATPQPICVNCLCVVEDFKDAATEK
jgi:hypothetical protein